MELTTYVESLRHDLQTAAAAGDERTRETARLLAAALDPAARLCLVDAMTAVADEVTARGGLGRFVHCEAGEPESVQRVIATIVEQDGALHGAVHNATSGLSPRPGAVGETTLADLRDHVAVSVRGTYLVAREALPHLEAVGGALVVLTSEAGFEGKAKLPAYAAVKAAQRGMVRSLAREWGPRGVRVNALAPLAAGPSIDEAKTIPS